MAKGKEVMIDAVMIDDDNKDPKLSWEYVDRLTHKMLGSSGWRPDFIVGLSRGGLVPAAILGNKFKRPVFSINTNGKSWFLSDQLKELHRMLSLFKVGPQKLLFVDDICDSGQYMLQLQELMRSLNYENWKDVKYGCLIFNCKGNYGCYVDFFAVAKMSSKWIVFPWENGGDEHDKSYDIWEF